MAEGRFVRLYLRLLATVLLFLGLTRPAPAECPTGGEETSIVAVVEPRLELRLADGRLVRLAGLDPPLQTPVDPDLAEGARGRIATMVTGREVTLHILARDPDRWGRTAAFAFLKAASDVDPPGGLASAAIAAGLGRYLAEPAAQPCRDVLLAAEAKARLATLGLWRDPYYAVLAVDDHAGFTERAGTVVLAEGRLSAVQPGPYRTTLRFASTQQGSSGPQEKSGQNRSGQGSYGGHMLVATIMPHAMKTFEARHMDLRGLIGQRLRFRGLLDLRFGPRIELANPDQVETIAPPIEAAAPPHSN